MKCVQSTGTVEVSLHFFTLFSPSLLSYPSFTPGFFSTGFAVTPLYQSTPPSNLRPVIFGSKPLAGLFPFIGLLYYEIFLFTQI
jgi:hypothetical protein